MIGAESFSPHPREARGLADRRGILWRHRPRCISSPRKDPITIRLYDPASLASFAFPLGFYIDRLSAVMMVLISGVGTIIYTYSVGYMYQDPHERRYLALIGVTDFVLLCMVSSGNLMMLFIFWQLLSYLLYVLAHNHAHAATLEGAFRTFTLLRVGDVAFLAGIVLAHSLYGTLEFPDLFAKAAEIAVDALASARASNSAGRRRSPCCCSSEA